MISHDFNGFRVKYKLTALIKAIIYFVISVSTICCSNNTKKELVKTDINTPSNVSFIFEAPLNDEYQFKDIEIKISRSLAKPNLMLSSSFGLLDVTISSLALSHYDQHIFLDTVNKYKKIGFDIEEGEYYISIDTYKTKMFQFEPIEDYFFVASFGFEYPANGDFAKFYETSRKQCESNVDYKINGAVTPKYIVCPKIIIRKDQEVIIKIKASEKEWSDMMTILFKIFPGIIALGPINNYPDPYFIRKFSIEIEYIDKAKQSVD